jgi:hypothetical protein
VEPGFRSASLPAGLGKERTARAVAQLDRTGLCLGFEVVVRSWTASRRPISGFEKEFMPASAGWLFLKARDHEGGDARADSLACSTWDSGQQQSPIDPARFIAETESRSPGACRRASTSLS